MHFDLSKKQNSNQLIEDIIIKTAREKHPETASQLISFVHQKTNLSEEEIMNKLNHLETEGKIHFNIKQELVSVSFGTYLLRSDSAWYWTIIGIAIATMITVFTISQDWYPIVYFRNVLGIIFVLFLPGYAFVKALFPAKVPIETSSESLESIERVVLSVGMSIAFTSIVGLILYYTPIGIGLVQITISLLAFTIGFATVGIVREHQTKSIITSY